MVSFVLFGIFGVPALADRLTPYVPIGVGAPARRGGRCADPPDARHRDQGKAVRVRQRRGREGGGGGARTARRPLEAAAALALPIRLKVLRKADTNAIALPGGHIYVFEGLINRAENADELAGVIAHEIGHVANRDGTRAVLQGAGLSFLFGMVLGDFVGGGAVVLAARTLLQSSYSREVERRADAFGVRADGAARRRPARARRHPGAHRRQQPSRIEAPARSSGHQGPAEGDQTRRSGEERRCSSRRPSGPHSSAFARV